jgi:hypothetical protein
MAISAQDKILYVANKLGLSTLKNMQGTTRAVYDSFLLSQSSFSFFEQSSQHTNPASTNVNDNRFEVNEALLVEQIGFFTYSGAGTASTITNLSSLGAAGLDTVVVFDFIIGNKTVMKQVPVFSAGNQLTFSNTGVTFVSAGPDNPLTLSPRHQVNLEGAGILIPPQVEFKVEAKIYDLRTGAVITDEPLGCYLYGTGVLLNFNTSI